MDRDPRGVEQLGDGGARLVAEDLERLELGVTRCISTSSMFMAQTSCAAMSASSYSGSGHEHPGGTTKATDVDQPCSRSATIPLSASGWAPNVSACG